MTTVLMSVQHPQWWRRRQRQSSGHCKGCRGKQRRCRRTPLRLYRGRCLLECRSQVEVSLLHTHLIARQPGPVLPVAFGHLCVCCIGIQSDVLE